MMGRHAAGSPFTKLLGKKKKIFNDPKSTKLDNHGNIRSVSNL